MAALLTKRQRSDLWLAYGLQEVASYLRARCTDTPQARRLALVLQRAIDRLVPDDDEAEAAAPGEGG